MAEEADGTVSVEDAIAKLGLSVQQAAAAAGADGKISTASAVAAVNSKYSAEIDLKIAAAASAALGFSRLEAAVLLDITAAQFVAADACRVKFWHRRSRESDDEHLGSRIPLGALANAVAIFGDSSGLFF